VLEEKVISVLEFLPSEEVQEDLKNCCIGYLRRYPREAKWCKQGCSWKVGEA
jgi:hypothetical protein